MTSPARRAVPCALAVLLLAATSARPVEAQRLAVRVVGDDSAAVASAKVDFWAKTRKVLSLDTRADGLAIVERKKLRGVTSVGARAIGYRAVSVPLGTGDTVTIALNRAPPRLPDIVVEPMPRYDCHPEDREARAVWRAASARYLLAPERGYWARGRGTREAIVLSRVSSPDAWDEAQWVVSGQARLQAARFIRDSGYAIRHKPGKTAGITGWGEDGPWRYPRLHTWDADHFASPEFGQFNALFLVSSGPTGWTLGFCSNRAKRPGISGEMRIDSTYAFVRVQWEFVTPRPREDAGGEVVFLAGTRTALLPLESYAWRRLNRTDGDEAVYFREGFLGDQWTINLGEPQRSELGER